MTQTAISEPVTGPTRHVGVSDSIARGALSLLSTQPLTWGASLLAASALPRLLGADALGQVAFVVTLAGLAQPPRRVLGVSEFLVRRVAQRPQTARQDAGIALSVQLMSTFVGALIIALVGPFLVCARRLQVAAAGPVADAGSTRRQTVLLSTFRGWVQSSTRSMPGSTRVSVS